MKLHLGCGKRNFGFEWIHIDGGDFPHVGIAGHDITKLPVNDNLIDLIYASHVMEYFDRQEVEQVLAEWRRVLKPGATLRLAVPDFEQLIKVYKQTQNLNNILGPLYGKMHMGEKTIYHKTAYDFDSLKILLEENGFGNVKRYDWRQTEHAQFDDHSQAYFPHMDKENGILVSLNVEAVKI